MIIKDKTYNERTYIMGILNVTPDSFSDGGSYTELDKALYRAEEIVKQGGDIIDVGGESTRPGFTVVSAAEETERIVPVIEALTARFDIPVSADTYKAETAEAALRAGAAMINDIWGFKKDEKMADIAAKYGASCCLMHNRANTEYKDIINDILTELGGSADIALKAGVPAEKICLDPGIGFAKTFEQNLKVLNYLEKFNALGYPLLLGTSRKSVIGLALDLPVDERLEGTVATSVMAVMKDCRFVRVHDVLANKRAIDMTERILKEK